MVSKAPWDPNMVGPKKQKLHVYKCVKEKEL